MTYNEFLKRALYELRRDIATIRNPRVKLELLFTYERMKKAAQRLGLDA